MHIFWVFFIFIFNEKSSDLTKFPHIMRGSVSLPCFPKPVSCVTYHLVTCSQLAICGRQYFAFVLEQEENRSAPDRGCVQDVPRFFSYEIICQVNLFSDRPS